MGCDAGRSRQAAVAVTRLGEGREFDLIRAFMRNLRRQAHPLVDVGAGDDCAIIGGLAISSDMSVEDVHFRRAWLAPREIGYRSTTAALSDLAAVTAVPVAALLSIALRQADANEWAEAVMSGAAEAVEGHGGMIAGGDVTRTNGSTVLDVMVIGKADRPVLRSTARTGDAVWVTGTLGGAAAAVAAWSSGRQPSSAARECYARPVARIREALFLQPYMNALIDLSDGIAGDAGHIAAASNTRVIIDAQLLPVHPDADARMALQGGEDFELCFTAERNAVEPLRAEFEQRFDIPLTRVGQIVAGAGVVIENADVQGGFDHFGTATT